MVSNVMKDKILNAIEKMSEEQAAALVKFIETMQPNSQNGGYDEASDPLIGFLDGPSTDLSIRAKQILRDELDPRSGWTQKDKDA